MQTARLPVLLGLDGSQNGGPPEAWALDEARSRSVPLRLVYAFPAPMLYASSSLYGDDAMSASLAMPDSEALRAFADEVLSGAADRLAAADHDVDISTQAYEGDPALVLIDQARTASTVVLGSRGHGSLGSAILGSVGTSVSARASCPVVVVRGSSAVDARESLSPQPGVVVGVQPDEDCEDVIEYAFDYASRHALGLHAVLCWHPDLFANRMWRPQSAGSEAAQAWLSEALAGWREKFPDVAVRATVTRDHPVDGLVAAASSQRLLVVGTHRRSALTGLLLGSVSQGVLHHADCPTAVVPPAVP